MSDGYVLHEYAAILLAVLSALMIPPTAYWSALMLHASRRTLLAWLIALEVIVLLASGLAIMWIENFSEETRFALTLPALAATILLLAGQLLFARDLRRRSAARDPHKSAAAQYYFVVAAAMMIIAGVTALQFAAYEFMRSGAWRL